MRPNTYPSIIIICLFLALCIWVGSVSPKYERLKALQIKKEYKKVELQYKKEYLSRLKQIEKKIENHKESLSKIETALPPNPSLASVFNFLQKTSSQNGLVLRGLNFATAPLKEKKEIKETKINMSLAGSYSAFKNFLSGLEKNSRLFVIDNISFSSPSKEDSPFHFSIMIKTYSY